MENKILEFVKLRDQLTRELKEWVKNKSIPLETRWETFLISELGDHRNWIIDINPVVSKHADYMNRYMTLELERVVESLEDELCYKEEVDLENLSIESRIQISSLKEDILEAFVKSFRVDW